MKVSLNQQAFVKEFKENRDQINDPVVLDYKEKILTVNEKGLERNLFFYIPEKEKIQKAKINFSSIFSALNKLTKYIVYDEPKLLNFLGKSSVDLDALKRRSSETLLGYARIDTILGDDKFKVLEFNSRRPQMYEDADWFSEYVSRAIGSENVVGEENGYEIIESIQSHFEINTKKRIPENIVVINNFKNHRYPYSSLTELNNYFDQSNIFVFDYQTLPNFYENIESTDFGIVYEGVKIDLIIIQSVCGNRSIFNKNGGIRHPMIAQAYNKGLIELYTQPAGQISGTKLSLDLIQNEELQTKIDLDQDEIEAIKTVPHSVHSYNIKDLTRFNKDDYVIKLTNQGQGIGVILGTELSQQEWKSKIEKLVNNETMFILQERVNFTETEIFNERNCRFEKAFLTLEPFIINNPIKSSRPIVSGYSTRAIPIDKFDANLKFNPAYDKPQIYFGAVIELSE